MSFVNHFLELRKSRFDMQTISQRQYFGRRCLSRNSQPAMLLWICSTFHKAAMCDRNLTSEPPEHRLSLGHQGAVAFSLKIK